MHWQTKNSVDNIGSSLWPQIVRYSLLSGVVSVFWAFIKWRCNLRKKAERYGEAGKIFAELSDRAWKKKHDWRHLSFVLEKTGGGSSAGPATAVIYWVWRGNDHIGIDNDWNQSFDLAHVTAS